MRNGFRVFDTHTHVGSARHSGRVYSADELLRAMDAWGVEKSVAIPFPVVDDYRREHDQIGAAVKAHPDRIVGAVSIFPYIPQQDYRDEVKRCAEVYGFRGLKLQPQYHGMNPMLSSSDFLFEAALENGMAVIGHTGSGLPFAAPSLFMMPARKFPDLTIVLGHCGGGMFVHEAILAATFCPNIVLELSTLMPHHVCEVLTHVASDRLMVGSDLPESLETELGKVLTMQISDADKRNMLYDTAERVFG